MRKHSSVIRKYWKQYQWSNVFAMIRNSRKMPALCEDDFNGRLLVITGATSGIGYTTTRKYAAHGANILSINRNEEKSKILCQEIQKDFDVECDYMIADLSRLADIHRVGNKLAEMKAPIHVLINNAGLYLNHRVLTEDGYEMTFVVNYLSSFILTNLVKDKLRNQGQSRVIMVNSEGYRFAVWGVRLDDLNWQKRRYSGLGAYGSAKIAQLLSMIIFNEYFKDSGVTINAMHPGAVRTGTGRENSAFYKWYKRSVIDRLSQSPEISAEALYYLGVSKEMDGVSGKFFNLTTEEELAPPALDREAAQKLWEVSLSMGGLT
jgi:NAD(P)-dependent dehydrogenase (short-subunit alcohol dehydrogenase family)